jgi:NitT/TauT family transport system substrate-binding protein
MVRWQSPQFRPKRSAVVLAAAAALLVAACSSSASSAGGSGSDQAASTSGGTTNLNVTVSAASVAYAALYIAEAKGYFQDEGLHVNITTVSGGGATVPALLSNSAQFGFSSVFHQMDGAEAGQRVVSIGAINIGEGLDVVISKKKAQQLGLTASSTLAQKGAVLKNITVGALSDSGEPYYVLADLAKQGGLNPSQVKIESISGTGAVTALERGEVDAIEIGLPVTTEALASGDAETLISCPAGDLPNLVGDAIETVLANPAYVQSHESVAKRFLAAIGKAQAFYTSNPTQAGTIVRNAYFQSVPESVYEAAWKEVLKVLPSSPTLTLNEMQRTINFVDYASGKKVNLTAAELLGTVS